MIGSGSVALVAGAEIASSVLGPLLCLGEEHAILELRVDPAHAHEPLG